MGKVLHQAPVQHLDPGKQESGHLRGLKRSSSVVIAKRKMCPANWTELRMLGGDMRITIQAVISDVNDQEARTEDIGVLEYDAEAAPASGLGLFIGEAHQLLRQLQTVVLREQAARFMERMCRCRQCGSRLGVKDSKSIVYRTVYGKARLDSPRLYSTCGRCGARATPARSFSPLADARPERTHPQWLWLQSRYAVCAQLTTPWKRPVHCAPLR